MLVAQALVWSRAVAGPPCNATWVCPSFLQEAPDHETMRHRASRAILASLERHLHDAPSITSQLSAKGFAPTNHRLLTKEICEKVRARLPRLFRGEFDTGNYPDEWHWREGISKEHAAREICNAWKSDLEIASVVLNEDLGRFVADVMGWDSVRIAQDDVVWKPPSAHQDRPQKTQRIDTVGFHQDSAYISSQFQPYENNSVTVWMALDDANEENGCVEYAVGSHKWRPLLHHARAIETQKEGETNDDNGSEISSFHSADESSYRKGISVAASLAGCDNPLELIEAAPVKEGHAIFHHQDAWHGSGPNSSTLRHRRALVGHYIRGDVTFVESKGNGNGPFGNASYIYGRYRTYNSVDLDESFFPIIYGSGGSSGLSRTEWVDDYIHHSCNE